MKRQELLKEIEKVAEEKRISLNLLNLKNSNKKTLERILNCFNLSDERMTKFFQGFAFIYPNSAKKLENNFLHYGWGRFHIYTSIIALSKKALEG